LEQQLRIGRQVELDMVLKLEDECEFYNYRLFSMSHVILDMMVFEVSIKFQPPFGP
jgi:hypothetical protein